MNPLKKLAGQTAIYGISSIVGRLMNFLLVPFYTRIFTGEQYGIVTEMYAYVAFLVVVLTYGMETAYFRFSTKHENASKVYPTTLLSVAGTSLLFIACCSLFNQPIGDLLGYPNHAEYVTWFAIIVGLDAISAIPLARLRQLNKAKTFMIINLVNVSVNIGLNLFFLVYCKSVFESGASNWLVDTFYRPEIGVGYVFISNLVASIVKWLSLTPWIVGISLSWNPAIIRQMLPYALPLMILGLAGIINETLDRVMLKHLLPLPKQEALEQLGIYGACYKIAIIMSLCIQAFRYAAEPFFFAKTKDADSHEVHSKVMTYFVILGALVVMGITLFLDVAILFIGEEFRAGKEVVPILLVAYLFYGIVFNLSFWYKLSEKTLYGAGIAIFGALITIALNYWLIPQIGYVGSAWATLACYAAMMIVSYFLGRVHYRINYNLSRILLYLILAGSLTFIGVYFKPNSGIAGYFINTFIILLYLGVVYFLERPRKTVHS